MAAIMQGEDGQEPARNQNRSAVQHAIAQLSQLAETRELLEACPFAEGSLEELIRHNQSVVTTLLSMRLEAFRNDEASQVKILGQAAVGFGLMTMSALGSLPASQPTAILRECREKLTIDGASRGSRSLEELYTDLADEVR